MKIRYSGHGRDALLRELNMLEDILNEMPSFITTRGEVYDYLLGSARECLKQ